MGVHISIPLSSDLMIPTTMRYVTYGEGGGPEVLRIVEGPIPEISDSEVLIEVHAAGVNRPDILQRAGNYPPPPGASPILGLEVAGRVVALGAEVTAWKVGDQVCALTPGGGYAEYCRTDASHCLPLPKDSIMQPAAAIPENFFTVWANLVSRGTAPDRRKCPDPWRFKRDWLHRHPNRKAVRGDRFHDRG